MRGGIERLDQGNVIKRDQTSSYCNGTGHDGSLLRLMPEPYEARTFQTIGLLCSKQFSARHGLSRPSTNSSAPRLAKRSNENRTKKMDKADSPSSDAGSQSPVADLLHRTDGDADQKLSASAAQSPELAKTIAGDILYGADQIAEFLYGDKKHRRKVYNLVETGRMPHFRLGAGICARQSVLIRWIETQENPDSQGRAVGSREKDQSKSLK
jgi:hypothetical protein